MKPQLRESQQVALERLAEPGRTFAALWAEPRSGKTGVSLLWLQHIQPSVAVVVAPKVAEAVWKTEAAKWLTVDYRYFPLTAGNTYPSLESFKGITILFVNYEQFGKSPFKRLRPFLEKVSKHYHGQGAMILDESHAIKTPSSVVGRNIRPLASKWKYRLLVTGTPVTNPNQIDAVYGQWTFLNPEIRDKWPSARDFREHFGEWTNVKGFPELIKPIRQYELNAYLQPDVVTMTGAGKPVPVRVASYQISEEAMLAHNELLKNGLTKLQGHTVVGLNPLTRLLRMRMLLGGWVKDDQGESFIVHDTARSRLKVLHGVLRRCQGKVIVACTHIQEVKLVSRFLSKQGIGHLIITGAVKDKNSVIEEFQKDRDIKVLLVQPRTVAMAVDISVANDLIWYTSDFNYVTFKQTSDRIKLSPANPTVWFIRARGTVDDDVFITLRKDHAHLRKVISRIERKFA